MQDTVQKKVQKLLKTKAKDAPKSKAKKQPAAAKQGGNVINIMDALKKSLQS